MFVQFAKQVVSHVNSVDVSCLRRSSLAAPSATHGSNLSIASLRGDELAHDGIVKSSIVRKRVNDTRQINTSTSKYTIITAVKAAVATDDALQLFRVK